jgi:hypothetical protein
MNGERSQEQASEQNRNLTFEMETTYAVAPVLQEPKHIDEAYFDKIWKWVQEQEQAQGRGLLRDETKY